MPSPAGVARSHAWRGPAQSSLDGEAIAGARGWGDVFRCEPSTAGVVWLIAAPAFSLSRENRLFRCQPPKLVFRETVPPFTDLANPAN